MGSIVPCIFENSAASLASTHSMPVASPLCHQLWQQKMSPVIKNHLQLRSTALNIDIISFFCTFGIKQIEHLMSSGGGVSERNTCFPLWVVLEKTFNNFHLMCKSNPRGQRKGPRYRYRSYLFKASYQIWIYHKMHFF